MNKQSTTGRLSIWPFFSVPALVLAGGLTLSLAIPAVAQPAADGDEKDQDKDAVKEEVVVTATRTAMPLSKIGSSISVVTADDLKRDQAAFLEDALRSLPGISLSRSGNVGGVTSAFIRGESSGNTLVMIDGVEVNDPAAPGGPFNFGNLSTADIERVEVLRGPQSLLYGSRAIGGVINIITRDGQPGFQANGSFESGAFNSFRAQTTLSGGTERVTFRLSADGFRTDGISAADKRDGNTERDGLDQATVSTRLGIVLSSAAKIDAHVRVRDSNTDFDGFDFSTGRPVDANNVNDATSVEAGGSLTFESMNGALETIFSGARFSLNRDSLEDSVRTIASLGKRREFSLQSNLHLGSDAVLTVGLEREKTSMDFTFFSAFGNFPTAGAARINSAFGQFQITLDDVLTVTAGVRRDDHSTFGGATTFRFTGAIVVPGGDTIIRSSYGEGFKAPSLFDLFDPFTGNPGLLPEENQSYDIGIEHHFLKGRAMLRGTWFDTDSKNLIGFSFATFTSANTARSRARGVEIEASIELTESLRASANYTLTSARDKDLGSRLVRRPKNAASANLYYQGDGRLGGSLAVSYTGKKADTGGIRLDDYVLIEARATYRLWQGVSLFGRVENLLDKKYQEIFGFGAPGASVFAGLRMTR